MNFKRSKKTIFILHSLLSKFRAIGSRKVGASPLTSNLATQCQHLRLDSRPVVVEEGPLLGPEGKGGRGMPGGVKCRPLVEADTSPSDQVSAGERPVFHIFPVRFYDIKDILLLQHKNISKSIVYQ